MSQENPVEHIAYLWPEVAWPYANVLCEGPSIDAFDPEDLLKGPTVAVNHAICLSERTRVDFWAMSDAPSNLWDWAAPYRNGRLRYFTTDQNTIAFTALLGQRDISKVYSAPPTLMERRKGGAMILPTVIPVLGWLLRSGVRHVRVFGADMHGSGSPLADGYEEKAKGSWKGRWLVERRLFAHAVRAYRARGARLERRHPTPTKTAT